MQYITDTSKCFREKDGHFGEFHNIVRYFLLGRALPMNRTFILRETVSTQRMKRMCIPQLHGLKDRPGLDG